MAGYRGKVELYDGEGPYAPTGLAQVFSLGGYSLNATSESVNNSQSDNNDDASGSVWETVIKNAGGILNSIASNVNAFKGNQPTYNVNVPQQQQKMDYTMIIIIVVALLFLTGVTIVLIKKSK